VTEKTEVGAMVLVPLEANRQMIDAALAIYEKDGSYAEMFEAMCKTAPSEQTPEEGGEFDDQSESDNLFCTKQLLERAAKCMGVEPHTISFFDVVGHLEALQIQLKASEAQQGGPVAWANENDLKPSHVFMVQAGYPACKYPDGGKAVALYRGPVITDTSDIHRLVGNALDLHLGDDSPDPISKTAFAAVVELVGRVLNSKKEPK